MTRARSVLHGGAGLIALAAVVACAGLLGAGTATATATSAGASTSGGSTTGARTTTGPTPDVTGAAPPGPAASPSTQTSSTAGTSSTTPSAIPVLAYYYIWFDPSSWDRAKRDEPLIGRYSSDERAVMRKHIQLAKAAGIDGFIVSWKDTPKLSERLSRLVEIAREENFKLGIVYQGLDFSREPIPLSKIEHDLVVLADRYAADPVFHIVDDRPMVVWTGTDQFSDADLEQAVAPVKDRLLMLASSRSIEQYERVAPFFEGSAYYWSSVNPEKSWYPGQLAAMGQAVHDTGGLWVAPAASGFDARLIGGSNVVDRQDGRTLVTELNAAVASKADAVGLISWNEFSENSHVEPSRLYGDRALQVLADWTGNERPAPVLDSSVGVRNQSTSATTNGVVAIVALSAAIGALVVWRRWRGATDVPATAMSPVVQPGRHLKEET